MRKLDCVEISGRDIHDCLHSFNERAQDKIPGLVEADIISGEQRVLSAPIPIHGEKEPARVVATIYYWTKRSSLT